MVGTGQKHGATMSEPDFAERVRAVRKAELEFGKLRGDDLEAHAFARASIEEERDRLNRGWHEEPALADVCAVGTREDVVGIYHYSRVIARRTKAIMFWARLTGVCAVLTLLIVVGKLL